MYVLLLFYNMKVFRFVNDPGFGDNVRGLISILQIQKILKFELEVDFSQHVFGNFFQHLPVDANFKHYNLFIYSDFKHNHNDTKLLTDFLSNDSDIIISTNIRPMEEIDEDIKLYLKNLFELKPKVKKYLQEKISMLPNDYHLFHYRLGDNVDKKKVNNDIYLQHFKTHKKENAVIISDSLRFKEIVGKDAFVFLNPPTHTNSNEENIDTLVDFFLLTNAKTISCYSIYDWISNFVFWSSIIYDIPLFNIKET